MERYLIEVIGNWQHWITLLPPCSWVYNIFVDRTYVWLFGLFTLTIKFSCLFLGIFQSFYWLVTLIFDKLAPLRNICFKRCFKSLFGPFQRKKTVPEKLKTWYFPYSAFWLTCQWKGYNPPPPPIWLRYCFHFFLCLFCARFALLKTSLSNRNLT